MKNKFRSWRWPALIIFLAIMFEASAFATGYYFHLKSPNFAYRQDGSTKVTVGAPAIVQIITGRITQPGSMGELSTEQAVVYSGTIGDGNVVDGEFEYLYGVGNSQPIFIRIWPDGIGNDKTYGQSGQLTTSAAGDNANETPIPAITCNRKLAAPTGVNCAVGSYALTYNAASAKYLPSFVVSPTNASGGFVLDSADSTYIPIASIHYEIAKVTAGVIDWTNALSYVNGSVAETNADNPFYTMGGNYAVRAFATNVLPAVVPVYGTVISFTIPAGASGAATTQTWAFRKTTTGINTISIPFILGDPAKPVTLINDALIGSANGTVTAQQLIQAINTQIAPAKVTVFGWWDETTQTHKGASALNTDVPQYIGGAAATDFVVTGRPYQVSVNTDSVSFQLKGFRQ